MPAGCNRTPLVAPTAPTTPPAAERTLTSPAPRAEIGIAGRTAESPADAAYLLEEDGTFWRSLRTPEGDATLRLRPEAETLQVCAWGAGAAWSIDAAEELLGRRDESADSFVPDAPLLAACGGRSPSRLAWRLGRSSTPYETLLAIVVAQRVTGKEAWRGYRALLRRWGRPGPGPAPTWIAPEPAALARIDVDELTALGIDPRRARVLVGVARQARALEGLAALSREDAYRRLLSLSGIGPWSAAKLMLCALGDPDAVWVDDAHLADHVVWNLAGEARGSDARMLELLEPYRGHRARVARLLELHGRRKPRFGARVAVTRYR